MALPEQLCTVTDPQAQQVAHTAQQVQELLAVREVLFELPQCLEHEVLVPLSPVGFVMGKIKHTNEIIVHLGAEYYMKRTCSQALEILDRRLSALQPPAAPAVPEPAEKPPATKEEALARLQRLALEEEKAIQPEIKEHNPAAVPKSAAPEPPKRVSKFMRERQGL